MKDRDKKQIVENVKDYYHKSSLHSHWHDVAVLFNKLREEVDWLERNYKPKYCEEESAEYREFRDFKKLTHQLGEVLMEYHSHHPEPKDRPLEHDIRLYFNS